MMGDVLGFGVEVDDELGFRLWGGVVVREREAVVVNGEEVDIVLVVDGEGVD